MLSCGEPSGDLYAGALTRELRRLDPAITVSGLGGPQFSRAGGELIADYRRLTATGLIEPIGKVPQSFATLRRLDDFARTRSEEHTSESSHVKISYAVSLDRKSTRLNSVT